jgi:hypothetical protein
VDDPVEEDDPPTPQAVGIRANGTRSVAIDLRIHERYVARADSRPRISTWWRRRSSRPGVRFRLVAAVPTCPLARQREAHWRLHELGDWRTAALILAAGRAQEDWMALGYAGVGEWMADCGVSRSYACQLLAIARAGGAAPGESVKHAYQRSRVMLQARAKRPDDARGDALRAACAPRGR